MAMVAVEMEGGTGDVSAKSEKTASSGWEWVTNAVNSTKEIVSGVVSVASDVKKILNGTDDVAKESISGKSSGSSFSAGNMLPILGLVGLGIGIFSILK